MLAIARCLILKPKLLILDEPTGVLTPQEVEHLFRILAALRKQGKTIILITHKLREIMALTDDVTVMRGGEVVAQVDTAETTREQLAAMMVGRTVLLRVEKGEAHTGDALLEIENLNVNDRNGLPRVKNVSFSVRAGEIVGIAGVAGNGQSELLEALAGILPPQSGRIRIKGEEISGTTARGALRSLGRGGVRTRRSQSIRGALLLLLPLLRLRRRHPRPLSPDLPPDLPDGSGWVCRRCRLNA